MGITTDSKPQKINGKAKQHRNNSFFRKL